MAEKEKLTDKQKGEREELQLDILKDKKLKQFAVAYFGKNESQFGQMGKVSTHMDYSNVMANPSKSVSEVISKSFLYAEQGEMYAGSVTPGELLKNAKDFYFGGLDYLKVSKVLELMGSEISDEVLAEDQKSMYMEDFKAANEEDYKKIT